MICLVTGGAGFIGSHLVDRLLKDGHFVVCLDNFDPYYDPNLKRENIMLHLNNKNLELIEGDIRDQELMRKIIIDKDIDYIFHEAAQSGVRVSVENPMKTHEVNATGTLNILKACLDSNVKKIIYASSSSVYGKVMDLPFKEKSLTLPISPYGVSKLVAEHYMRVFYEIYGLKTTTLRYFTVYGPRMRPDLAISIFTKKALKNKTIEIFGSGEKTRDFTYIDDVVEANIKAMKKGDGEAYNIGSGNRISINELANKIVEITNSKSNIIRTDPRKGDAEHTLADINKAKRELNWAPKVNIDEGLKRFIQSIYKM